MAAWWWILPDNYSDKIDFTILKSRALTLLLTIPDFPPNPESVILWSLQTKRVVNICSASRIFLQKAAWEKPFLCNFPWAS